eukprot:scaffold1621_cov150-Pinguiococcus_pyrenoidosus.AAC.1
MRCVSSKNESFESAFVRAGFSSTEAKEVAEALRSEHAISSFEQLAEFDNEKLETMLPTPGHWATVKIAMRSHTERQASCWDKPVLSCCPYTPRAIIPAMVSLLVSFGFAYLLFRLGQDDIDTLQSDINQLGIQVGNLQYNVLQAESQLSQLEQDIDGIEDELDTITRRVNETLMNAEACATLQEHSCDGQQEESWQPSGQVHSNQFQAGLLCVVAHPSLTRICGQDRGTNESSVSVRNKERLEHMCRLARKKM